MNEPYDILLVEDNPNDLELALYAFSRCTPPPRIRVARDGVEALQALLGTPDSQEIPSYRLVLLDLKLPRVDGLEVLRELHRIRRDFRVPLVVLTSSHEPRDLEEAYRSGASSFLVKPVDFDRFITMIQETYHYWFRINSIPGCASPDGPDTDS